MSTWVYPDLLSTYGDRGNVHILEQRAVLRGIAVETVHVNSEHPVPTQGDVYVVGGGEDRPQKLAAQRLLADGNLARAADAGRVVLAVCAGYQLLGTEFGDETGAPTPGLGVLDTRSTRADRRAVGEVAGTVDPALALPALTGFENHRGVTVLGAGVRPLATDLACGIGNGDGTEGAQQGHIVGTYLHGPVLGRNPDLADLLLGWATGATLAPLDDTWVARLREERLGRIGMGTA